MQLIQSVNHCLNLLGFFKGTGEWIKGIPYIWGICIRTKILVVCGVWAGMAYGPWSLMGTRCGADVEHMVKPLPPFKPRMSVKVNTFSFSTFFCLLA